jgi:two-component system, cell cycle response regulator
MVVWPMSYKNRILVADDNPVERENIEDLLSPEGYELALARNGAQALALAVEFMPDLILLDVMMPEMDGFEVCRRLRSLPVTADIPILLVTALSDRKSRLDGIEAGADDFICKPFDTVELRARVRSITRLNRYRRLLAERAKFERVVEHAQTGYVLLSDNDEILFANSTAARYLDMPAHNGQKGSETFLAQAKKQYHCEPAAAWKAWPRWPAENTNQFLIRPETATSQAMWLRVDILDYLVAGPRPTWIVSLSDVTEQMASHRDRNNFHKMVTHKMRTPFISILTGLELLINHIDQLSQEEISELSNDAYKWAKRLYDDVEEVLHYSGSPILAKPEQGFNLTLLPVLVTNVCASMGLSSVSITGTENLMGTRVSMAKPALEAIFWEVLGNARKFHPQNQPIIEISVAYEGFGEVTIQISDDGLTLSPEQLERVWTPYYQGEKHFTGMVEGMGLGLSLVASLVWSVGGRCRLYNRNGRPGVTVDLTLPCQMTEAAAKAG